jgi:hypothetical protein
LRVRRNNDGKEGSRCWRENRVGEGSIHIKPAALKSFCNLVSSAQACASRTSGSEGGRLSSKLFPLWLILAAVSGETVVGSSSREREKPCRKTARPPNAARNLRDSGCSIVVELAASEEARMLRSHLLTLQKDKTDVRRINQPRCASFSGLWDQDAGMSPTNRHQEEGEPFRGRVCEGARVDVIR